MEIKEENKRFALYDDGKEIGEITWQEAPDDVLVVDHTFVDSAYRGQKLAQKLLNAVVEKRAAKIEKSCQFVHSLSKSSKKNQNMMMYWLAEFR